MSPVIYRPAGSGPDPEQPPRVPIAGPGIPTAASFADDTKAPAPERDPGEPVDLDDDSEMDEDTQPFLNEQDLYGDDDDIAPAKPVASSRRPALQRRRRRILGRSHEPAREPDPQPQVAPPPASLQPSEPQPSEPQPSEPDDTAIAAPSKRIEELADESDQPAPPRPRRVRTLHISAPPVGPADEPVTEVEPDTEPEIDTQDSEPAAEERAGAATISGHVLSTRGRGLSGISLMVVDPDDQVVGTAITGRRGQFAVENLPSGTYRLGARDRVDGDFVDGWHCGDDAGRATEVRLDDDGTTPDIDIDITLIGRVAIAAVVDAGTPEVVVDITVLDRSTGLPGDGAVTVSTDQFRAQLPLTEGRASITLFSPGIPRLRVEYPGSAHTSPGTRTLRLR